MDWVKRNWLEDKKGQRASRGSELLRQSDVQAERIIAILRMALSASLFLGLSGLLPRLEVSGLGARRLELQFLLFGAACYFMLVVGTAIYRLQRLVDRVATEVEEADNLRRFLSD